MCVSITVLQFLVNRNRNQFPKIYVHVINSLEYLISPTHVPCKPLVQPQRIKLKWNSNAWSGPSRLFCNCVCYPNLSKTVYKTHFVKKKFFSSCKEITFKKNPFRNLIAWNGFNDILLFNMSFFPLFLKHFNDHVYGNKTLPVSIMNDTLLDFSDISI